MDGDHGGSGDDNGGGDDQGEDRGDSSSCSSSALVAGAKVREAELEISSAGAVFRKVELA
jgi:hypothetical protein